MIPVYFATNRDMKSDAAPEHRFGETFNDDDPQLYRVGLAGLEKSGSDGDKGYVVKRVDVADESSPDPATGRGEVLGSSKVFDELRRQMLQDKRDLLVFIHGFANTFESSLIRAAELKQKFLIRAARGGAVYEPHMFVFSWPSNGEILPPWQYFSDRGDAAMSGLAMARALMRLLDFINKADPPCRQRLHLVAHSMGSWALRHALLALHTLLQGRTLPQVFEHVFLMAADEDADAFESDQKLGLLPQLGRHVHCYYSLGDEVLQVSDWTKFNPDRLGSTGPRTFTGLNARISAVDCSAVDHTELGHGDHQYYRGRGEVVTDVRHVLAGTPLDEISTRAVIDPGRRYRLKPQ